MGTVTTEIEVVCSWCNKPVYTKVKGNRIQAWPCDECEEKALVKAEKIGYEEGFDKASKIALKTLKGGGEA